MSNNISYVLDTNVIIDDHEIFTKLSGENIIIPLVVLEELDKLKYREGRLGEAARRANRSLEKLRILGTKQGTNLLRGIKIEETGTIIKIWGAERKTQVPPGMGSSNDNDIIMVAYEFKKEFKKDVILVSNDINVRVKCDALGVKTEKYDLTTTTNRLVTGIADPTQLPKKKLDELFSAGSVKVEAAYRGLDYESVADNLHLNQYGLITAYEQNGGSALVKYIKNEEDEWIAKTIKSKAAFGIKPKNAEQRFLMDALLDPNIQLVTVSGLPGSGKTFLAIAAALEQVQAQIFKKDQEIDFTVSKYQRKKKIKKQELATNAMHDEEDIEYSRMKYGVGGVVEKAPTKYNKIIVTKSIVPVGKDIGYLPGEKNAKLRPWLQPIWDNLEQIVGSKETIEMMTDEYTGIIEMEATAHVRGRSIANSIMIIDEAQNMSVHEIKTLLTRMAEGSKIILTGDINQIDSYNLDRYNNGLSVVAEKFKDKPYSAHITLTEGHRLPLVQDANDLL